MATSMRVLHVDDELEFVELAARFLERENDRISVKTATSASDGLARLADETFDCVISEYDMPGTNGIEFLETVRKDRPDLPFILFTGKGSEAVASEAISAGVTDYVQKRSGAEQYELLANRVQNALEQYRSQRRLARHREEYQRLFEQAPIMFAIFRDEDGKPVVDRCNERFAQKLGYDRDSFEGRSVREFYAEESVFRAIDDGGFERALAGQFVTEERTLRTKDGDRIDVLVRAVPQTDATGAVTGTLALYFDVSEHKRRGQIH